MSGIICTTRDVVGIDVSITVNYISHCYLTILKLVGAAGGVPSSVVNIPLLRYL